MAEISSRRSGYLPETSAAASMRRPHKCRMLQPNPAFETSLSRYLASEHQRRYSALLNCWVLDHLEIDERDLQIA
jgi:hypothetical protein